MHHQVASFRCSSKYMPPRMDSFGRMWQVVCAVSLSVLLLGTGPSTVAAQNGSDVIADFLTMNGTVRMLGVSGIMQKGPQLEPNRTGLGVHAKQLLSNWLGIFLQGHVMDAVVEGGGPIVESDLGVEVFPIRAGPFALSLYGRAGVHNLSPAENEAILLQTGFGGGIYIAATSSFVIGINASQTRIDTKPGSRPTFGIQLLLR